MGELFLVFIRPDSQDPESVDNPVRAIARNIDIR